MLHEKYRPRTYAEVVGQDRAISAIQRLPAGGCALWITGKSGTGKTTLAYLAARERADELCIAEMDAGELTPAGVRDIERSLSCRGMEKGGRVVIVNESHGLRRDTVRALLVALERIPSHATWIFTTTVDGQDSLFEDTDDAGPLVGRCVPIALAQRGLAQAFAERARSIAQAEGLDGRPIGDYVRLVNDSKGSLRMALSRIQAGAMLPE